MEHMKNRWVPSALHQLTLQRETQDRRLRDLGSDPKDLKLTAVLKHVVHCFTRTAEEHLRVAEQEVLKPLLQSLAGTGSSSGPKLPMGFALGVDYGPLSLATEAGGETGTGIAALGYQHSAHGRQHEGSGMLPWQTSQRVLPAMSQDWIFGRSKPDWSWDIVNMTSGHAYRGSSASSSFSRGGGRGKPTEPAEPFDDTTFRQSHYGLLYHARLAKQHFLAHLPVIFDLFVRDVVPAAIKAAFDSDKTGFIRLCRFEVRSLH